MPEQTSTRKARGAFFTPPELASFIVEWAITDSGDTILEPSCGQAAFLRPTLRRLKALGLSADRAARRVLGVELHEDSISEALAAVSAESGVDLSGSIVAGDFFDLRPGNGLPSSQMDAVVGNPPYVRYQSFNGESRVKARQAALEQGVRVDGLASSWAPFVVHAAAFLKVGGRLGLVLPAELLAVNYAAPVRRFLLERFAQVRLVLFEEKVFPEVSEEVVLLLAEGEGPCRGFDLVQVRGLGDLPDLTARDWQRSPSTDKWTSMLAGSEAVQALRDLMRPDAFVQLREWGRVALGMVTGANSFFCLSRRDADQLGLADADLLPIVPPGSKHLRGELSFGEAEAGDRLANGAKGLLFRPAREPSAAARRYIAEGEKRLLHHAYKCRVRTPWWAVPLVDPADLLLTYMSFEAPKLVSNEAGARHVNSIHGLYAKPDFRALASRYLPLATTCTATRLGAELVGRSYGGGLLKLEPKEAMCLPVPGVPLVERCADALDGARDRAAAALAQGDGEAAVAMIDQIMLVDGLGVDPGVLAELTAARSFMFERRRTRSRG